MTVSDGDGATPHATPVPIARRDPWLVARSAAMRQVVDLARRAAKVESTVLITGESGVGKEMIARRFRQFDPLVARQRDGNTGTRLKTRGGVDVCLSSRDDHARRFRGGHCAAQFGQASDVSGRRGRDRDPVDPCGDPVLEAHAAGSSCSSSGGGRGGHPVPSPEVLRRTVEDFTAFSRRGASGSSSRAFFVTSPRSGHSVPLKLSPLSRVL